MKRDLLKEVREGGFLTNQEMILLIIQLSIPGILAKISTVVMEYIDASMVGRLGTGPAAAIGLVSSTTWLFHGLCNAVSTGFTVQVAHRIGAGQQKEARQVMRHGFEISLIFCTVLALTGVWMSGRLPVWLGGDPSIRKEASAYFLVFSMTLPAFQLSDIAAGMLQCSGNMRVPGTLNIVGCVLDVFFNFFLIFPSRRGILFGRDIMIPGAGLGVTGAALGTSLSILVTALLMMYFLFIRSPMLHFRKGERSPVTADELKKALGISVPVGLESFIMGGAYVAATKIVSPLGTVSLAANSFAVTAEGLCYMPGYGIAIAATTLIGQTLGAGRKKLAKKLSFFTVGMGVLVMSVTGALMFIFAPQMIGILSPDPEIRELGAAVLRIEAFAEPLFAVSIVISGVFRGAGDTLVPSILNLFSMWAVRLVLSSLMAPVFGLRGVWTAMCIELWVRGLLFLIRLIRRPVGSGKDLLEIGNTI